MSEAHVCLKEGIMATLKKFKLHCGTEIVINLDNIVMVSHTENDEVALHFVNGQPRIVKANLDDFEFIG